MKIISSLALSVLLAGCGSSTPENAKSFIVKQGGITIETSLKPTAKATAREYKATLISKLKK
jgi:uncharacterized lipoprotein YehR (DUF1307 family)